MRRLKTTVALAVLMLVVTLGLNRDGWAGPRQGDSELLVSGGLFHSQGTDDGTLNADLSYGYFLTPGWELGFRQSLNYSFRDDRRDVWNATTSPFLHYNIPLSEILFPYLGVFAGAVWNDRDITGTAGPAAGLKVFVMDRTFLNVGYRYEIFFDDLETIDNNTSDGNHVFNIGVGFTWGGAKK